MEKTKMAEQTESLVNPVLQKKIDGYRVDNFAVPQELTLTITLSEYRELVTTQATCDNKISEATQARWKVEHERDELKNSLTEAKDTLERVRNDLSVVNNKQNELLKEKEQLAHDLEETRKQRDEAISQLEKLRSPSLTPVKQNLKK